MNTYDGKLILLILNGRHEQLHPFSCRCKSKVSPLQLHKPNPTTKKAVFARLNNLPNDQLTTTTVLIWQIINPHCRGGRYPSCDVFNKIKKIKGFPSACFNPPSTFQIVRWTRLDLNKTYTCTVLFKPQLSVGNLLTMKKRN